METETYQKTEYKCCWQKLKPSVCYCLQELGGHKVANLFETIKYENLKQPVPFDSKFKWL